LFVSLHFHLRRCGNTRIRNRSSEQP